MAKDKLTEYDATAANNTVVGDVNLAENSALPSDMNNAVREVMSHLKGFASGTDAIDALTSDGNILVGTTDTVPSNNGASGDAGVAISPDGVFRAARSGNVSLDINRMDSDGQIAAFRANGSTVGSISVSDANNLSIDCNTTDHAGLTFATENILPRKNSANTDNAVDLGAGSARFKNAYLSGNLYLGGTGSNNALSDYETGTWTPTFLASGTNPTINSVGNGTGYYVKVGDIVHFAYYSSAMNIGSAGIGVAYVGNLPFTSSNGSNEYWLFQYIHGTAIGGSTTGGYINQNQNFISFIQPNSTSGIAWTAGSPQYMMIAGSYRAA